MAEDEGTHETMRQRKEKRWRHDFVCHCCRRKQDYCLNCPCGFQICRDCFAENLWGLSNGPTWICPDCGRVRMT